MSEAALFGQMTAWLPEDLEAAVKTMLNEWQTQNKVRRLWEKDASLWSGQDESKWLDWLHIVDEGLKNLEPLEALAKEVKDAGFKHVLLLGMGGSSLCPEVLEKTFGHKPGYPELRVLDSTDPAQVANLTNGVDLKKTLFVVSSKSGGTLEPNIFKQYFFKKMQEALGNSGDAGSHFIAITDPGSAMEAVAKRDHFRHIFYGVPGIGGRYSALSNFGLVPAALIGLDVKKFLTRTSEMVAACGPNVPAKDNPGVWLGVVMGVAATQFHRDKLTIVTSPSIWDLGAWLEQLIAESTGKEGKGIIPVDREKLGPGDVYGNDRLFAYIRDENSVDQAEENALKEIAAAGQPIVRLGLRSIEDLGQQFFLWEIATAVAGSILGINAFNQPDVEASKVETKKLTSEYEKTGALPKEKTFSSEGELQLFTDDKNQGALNREIHADPRDLKQYLKTHLDRLKPGDYFALSAYIEMSPSNEAILQKIRHKVRDSKKVATCLGFGPRFLHSTGQDYKGGPNSGVFLQITCDDAQDLPVPDQKYTFGVVKAAQARGDFQVLVDRDRRVLRVHLGKDVRSGLAALENLINEVVR